MTMRYERDCLFLHNRVKSFKESYSEKSAFLPLMQNTVRLMRVEGIFQNQEDSQNLIYRICRTVYSLVCIKIKREL